MSAPQPNINNLWIQNPNKSEIDVLVLLGDSIPSYSPISLNSGGLLQAGIGSLSGTTWTMILPTPTSGYAYRIQSITIINQTSTSQLFQIASLFEGSTLYLPFFAQNLSANSAQSFSLNGQLITTSIAQNLTGTGIGVNMFYDLVKL